MSVVPLTSPRDSSHNNATAHYQVAGRDKGRRYSTSSSTEYGVEHSQMIDPR